MGCSWEGFSPQSLHFDTLLPPEKPGWFCTLETEAGGLVKATQRVQGQSRLQETLSQNGTEGIKSAHRSGL